MNSDVVMVSRYWKLHSCILVSPDAKNPDHGIKYSNIFLMYEHKSITISTTLALLMEKYTVNKYAKTTFIYRSPSCK